MPKAGPPLDFPVMEDKSLSFYLICDWVYIIWNQKNSNQYIKKEKEMIKYLFKTSLAVQWLILCAFLQGAWVQLWLGKITHPVWCGQNKHIINKEG